MLRATLKTGEMFTVDPAQGETLADLSAHLTADSLTGSAMPLTDATIRAVDGAEHAYGDVNVFEEGDE